MPVRSLRIPLFAAGAVLLALAMGAPAVAQDGLAGPSLAFGGDVLYDGPLVRQLAAADGVTARDALRWVLGDVALELGQADLSLVNLETPVSPRYRRREEGGPPVFRAPPVLLDALRDAGVDAVTVANNHAYDQGRRGLEETLRQLRVRGMRPVGAGGAAAAERWALGRARVAVAAWTEGTNARASSGEAGPRIGRIDDGTMTRTIRQARGDADFVVAVFHWVHGFGRGELHPEQQRVVRRAAEAGADLVIGHGTHVPGVARALETRDGRTVWVVPSLGNLRVSMEGPEGRLTSRSRGVRDAAVARVRTRWRGGRLAVAGLDLEHFWIARPQRRTPWLRAPSMPVSRTVNLEREIARLKRARCGAACRTQQRLYERRLRLVAGWGRRADEPRIARRRARRPSLEPLAPPYGPEPSREVVMPLSSVAVFAPGRALERDVNEAVLRRAVAALRRDPRAVAEVVAAATEEERAQRADLARLRGRRVQGLLAMRGPSRDRFRVRAVVGPPGAAVRVVVREAD